MSALLGEPPGVSVGHTVRGDSTVGPSTRVEVVTTGVLVRRLQRDPELPGVGAVVLDECHERHLDTDLALAFALDVRAALRPDLLAARDVGHGAGASGWRTLLGGAPVVRAEGALHPVERSGARRCRRSPRRTGCGSTRGCSTTSRPWSGGPGRRPTGDLLVFLPGAGEVGAVAGRLRDLGTVPLHGRLPAAEQDAALRPGPGAAGRAGDGGGREQPDRAGGAGRRGRRAVPGAAHRPRPRARPRS